MRQNDEGRVRRRHVFFVPGFDPFPARRYRELFRRELKRKACLDDARMTLATQPGLCDGWHVSCETGSNEDVETQFEVLDWSDLVAAEMPRSAWSPYRSLAVVLGAYWRSHGLWSLFLRNRGPAIVALYPVLCLSLQLLIAVALAVASTWAVIQTSVPLAFAVATLIGGAIFLALIHGFRSLDRWLYCDYLIHDFAYFVAKGGALPAELRHRTSEWEARLDAVLRSGCDEVLVVGHSAGVQLAAAALVARSPDRDTGAELAFLSLGHSLPMITVLPGATELRADLARLGSDPELFWVDVSAPGDPCCFPLFDPVDLAQVTARTGPLLISAAFSRTIDPARWRNMRFHFLRRHVQYLSAFENPADFDYFEITCGERTLRQRFCGRSHSPSARNAPVLVRTFAEAA